MTHSRAAALGTLLLVTSPSSISAQAIHLSVRDSSITQPLGGVIVTLVDAGGDIVASGITRSGREIVLGARRSGVYSVFVRKLGYSPVVSDPIQLRDGEAIAMALTMRTIPQFLPEVAIKGEQDDIRRGKFFGMQIASLGATIISPTQVDRAVLGARDLTDLVARNPSAGNRVDHEQECVLSLRGYPPACLPVIVDGVLTNGSNDVIPPEIVDYILIVRGNEVGVLYGTVGEQGAMLVFTKRGRKRGPSD